MYDLADESSYTCYIADGRRSGYPKIQIKKAGEEIFALLDTGSEMSLVIEI
jgi:hypothetical protein